MARFSSLKSLHSSVYPYSKWQWSMNIGKYSEHKYTRPSYSFVSRNYHTKEESPLSGSSENTCGHVLGLQSYMGTKCYKRNSFNPFSASLLNSPVRVTIPLVSVSSIASHRLYSSNVVGKGDKPGNVEVQAASGANDVGVGDSGSVGNNVLEKLKDAWQTAVDVTTYTGQKATEASKELSPHVQQFLDSHPYLGQVIVPVGSTLTATVLAWMVMPRLLRRFHNYASQSPVALLSGQTAVETYPYERSLWGALEDPVRYLVTFMAFSQIAMMVAPTTIASHYLAQTWRGAVILSFVWFLLRWKTNVFARLLAAKGLTGLDRDKLLAVDKLSSVGLFAIGIMSLAEACGVAVQSIMTVGGIGGVATAFASRDILGNVLSGLSMQFSKPFSLGDTIKAGSVEGRVVEMGLTTTSLLNAEKFPVIVPNSLFSSQVIVNKSRAQWRAMVRKIPLQIDDLNKIPQISDDIKNMLRSNSKVYLGMEVPYCFLSQIESSFAELTIGCNLKQMSKDELYSTEQDIILKAAQIIKDNGASLGSTYPDINRL